MRTRNPAVKQPRGQCKPCRHLKTDHVPDGCAKCQKCSGYERRNPRKKRSVWSIPSAVETNRRTH